MMPRIGRRAISTEILTVVCKQENNGDEVE